MVSAIGRMSNNGLTIEHPPSDVLMRIENFVSKYFFEVIESLIGLPSELARDAYWSFKSFQYSIEDEWWPRANRVQHHVDFKFYLKKPEIDDPAFLASPYFSRLKMLCPVVDEVFKAKKLRETFSVSDGTCYGQSLTAMKNHAIFDVARGVRLQGLDVKTIQHEVVFLQMLHKIQCLYKSVLVKKKLLDALGVKLHNVIAADGTLDEAKAFHFLRAANFSRAFARIFCTPNLIKVLQALPQEQEQGIARTAAVLENIDMDGRSVHLKAHKFAGSEERLREFLSRHTGKFIFIAEGRYVGHAMFIKIEQGRCITFDPGNASLLLLPIRVKEFLRLSIT